jgi:hypothetical protein
MKTRISNHRVVHAALLVFCSLLLASCNFPLPFQTPTPPGISDTILTQAAATIMAELGATQTQLALLPSPNTPTAIPPTATKVPPTATEVIAAAPPPQESPTPTLFVPPPPPTATNIPVFIPTSTFYPTPILVGGGYIPTVAITPVSAYNYPAPTRMVQMGTHFYVDNVNLAMCYGYYWSVFAISNNGTNDLESLSISVRDLSSGRYLYGPLNDNTPFMWADNTCEAGYVDTLVSGGWGFVGGKLNDPALKHHTLGATIKLCSEENLKGACFAKNLEFVVP